ncbi:DUF4350 domain-containing protein [Solirubrum puertoriconensis]|uniref:DUF4350 domain-containing protein n=1 Tax=Solirubrum puertoriconensis TaxID=1751427 RepID=A0A9X0HJ47_SOLP1|nr:DUF4350 domain-containing protein [Solirubrum puertoriconensis]KUG06840.1 hypothetical protein ASU33_05810 [Solirubrum puertoriconensis]
MLRSIRWPLTVLGILVGIWLLIAYNQPKKLDWTPSYRNDHKRPLGTYASFRLLPTLAKASVRPTRESPYVALQDSVKAPPAVYFLAQQSFQPSPADAQAITRYLQRGGTVWLAAEQFLLSDKIDSLWQMPATVDAPFDLDVSSKDTVRFRFVATALQKRTAALPNRVVGTYFAHDSLGRLLAASGKSKGQTSPGTVLALDNQQHPVLVHTSVGRGHLYVCSVPALLSNYGVLYGRNAAFVAGALSYLPQGPVLWDEFYTQGREGDDSLLRVVHTSPALEWAWNGLLIGGLLFALLGARRRQRPVPTLRPLPNTSLQFVRTVANVYRQGRNHQSLAGLRIRLFFDYLRTRFQEPVPLTIDTDYPRRLSLRTGIPADEVTALLARLNNWLDAEHVSETELHQLYQLLTNFQQRAER